MTPTITRRRLIGSLAAAGLADLLPNVMGRAHAETTTLSAVEWGGDVIEAMKQIAAAQKDVAFHWGLHQGGAAAILPKIKATWPQVDYDYIAGWEGSFNTMVKEDWLETIPPAEVPNLADIPEKIIIRDAAGAIKAVPRAVGGMYFGYRTDTAPVKLAKIDDLFDPKLKGAVCWPGPTQSMMLQIVALSLHAGGQ
jgi:putative spermidine/putrescine transport system substrate-binding protein